MRVLVSGAYWDLIGGSERYTRDVSHALLAAGHEVRVLAEATARLDQDDAQQTLLFPVPGIAAAAPTAEPVRRELDAFLSEFRPQVILVLVARNPAILETLERTAPVVRFVQDHVPFCPGRNKMLRDGTPCEVPSGMTCLATSLFGTGCAGLLKGDGRTAWTRTFSELSRTRRDLLALRRARHLLVASAHMAAELLAVGCERDHVTTLPYFTDAAPKAPQAADRGGNPPLILTPARLTLPDKGVDYLLTALGKVRSPFRALICGDGPAADWLRRKAREEGLAELVEFAGWRSPRELEELYARADIVAVPSMWSEPFGLVGIEAMAHGLPVVAFDVGGIGEWLHDGDTGSLVPRGDTQAFAAALDGLLSDAELRRRLGDAGRARVEAHHRAATHIASLEAVLERAAG